MQEAVLLLALQGGYRGRLDEDASGCDRDVQGTRREITQGGCLAGLNYVDKYTARS